jgi:hypothetical protein
MDKIITTYPTQITIDDSVKNQQPTKDFLSPGVTLLNLPKVFGCKYEERFSTSSEKSNEDIVDEIIYDIENNLYEKLEIQTLKHKRISKILNRQICKITYFIDIANKFFYTNDDIELELNNLHNEKSIQNIEKIYKAIQESMDTNESTLKNMTEISKKLDIFILNMINNPSKNPTGIRFEQSIPANIKLFSYAVKIESKQVINISDLVTLVKKYLDDFGYKNTNVMYTETFFYDNKKEKILLEKENILYSIIFENNENTELSDLIKNIKSYLFDKSILMNHVNISISKKRKRD